MLGPRMHEQKYKIWFFTDHGASDNENLIIFHVWRVFMQWFFRHTFAEMNQNSEISPIFI